MRDRTHPLRFFHVVPPVPPLMTATFVVLAIASGAGVIAEPGRAPGALAPVLLLQLFAASSGFSGPARRGHFDLLLTQGESRVVVGVAHWATSVAPGLTAWLGLAVAELTASRGASHLLLTSGTWAAIAMVSTLPWGLTVGLPRFSGAIGWLLVLVTVTTTFAVGVLDAWAVESTQMRTLLHAAWIFLLFPHAAVGQSLNHAQAIAVVPGLAFALATLIAALRWIGRADVPLEASQ